MGCSGTILYPGHHTGTSVALPSHCFYLRSHVVLRPSYLRFSAVIDQAWHLYKKYIKVHILTLETTLVTTYNTLCNISRLLYVISRINLLAPEFYI